MLEGCRPVSEVLDELMWQRGEREQLDVLTSLVMQAVEMDERAAEVVAAAWGCIEREELWRVRYDSLQQLQELLEFEGTVRPLVERATKTERQKLGYERQIKAEIGRAHV